MIIIEDTIISDEVVTKQFCCDLSKCKGCCCIEGDAGAPLEEAELSLLEQYFPEYKQFMDPEAQEMIEVTGFFDIDTTNDFTTPLIHTSACIYAYTDKDSILKCAIEKAYDQGLIPFKKPISCHLYPIRLTKLKEGTAVNYQQWFICKDAVTLGENLKLPVHEFLKEPLIRKFGQEWYEVLCQSAAHI